MLHAWPEVQADFSLSLDAVLTNKEAVHHACHLKHVGDDLVAHGDSLWVRCPPRRVIDG